MKKILFAFISLALPGLAAAACASTTSPSDGADTLEIPPADTGETLDLPSDVTPEGCPAGQIDCGGLCVDTSTDHDHCGGCASPCEPAEVCSNGVCLFECPTGTVACGGSCTDVMTDIQNCGGCDEACTAGLHAEPVCELGLCGVRCEAGWTDPDGDGSCDAGCAPTSPAETCNGVDDNCDGQVDESFPCRMGREVGCATVCGSTGSGVCGLDCQVPAAAACTPPAEVCNGQDDDCTGGCDNGLGCCRGEEEPCDSSCGTQGSRLCSALCEWSACIPPDETCNGGDDDCDGACDDGFGCCRGQSQSCGTGCGTTGTQTCSGGCTWGACEPPAETCNGADDDCDGTCDDGFGCCQGATGSCTTGCGTTGSRVCSGSCVWGSCAPPGETCNGTDDDCDGTCDNGLGCCRNSSGSCTTGCGSTGSRTCSGSCAWGSCTPPGESCNGADDDCDGTCDNGLGCCRNSSGSCTTTCGSTGSRVCSSSCTWGSCTPPAETCNGADEDCDGAVDNGFRAAILTTTFTHLYSHHPGCDGVTDRCGMSCKCAIHRECGSRGCYSSGFGPVEYSGDDAYMTCVAAADVVGVSFAELSTHHGGCNGPSASGTGACNAAISRYCASRGYVSGFGPVEQSATDAWVTCVRAAAKVGTTYTELSTHHGGCNGTTETVGCACNAAIKRFCVSRGYTSGFGPTEMSGDYAEVVCVFP